MDGDDGEGDADEDSAMHKAIAAAARPLPTASSRLSKGVKKENGGPPDGQKAKRAGGKHAAGGQQVGASTPAPPAPAPATTPAKLKVQQALEQAQPLGPDEWYEPFGSPAKVLERDDDYGDDDEDSEVVTVITPMDSVSMAGFKKPASKISSRPLKQYMPAEAATKICTVYMHATSGKRIAAKVDVMGITTSDELLRGLRAAFVHYTQEPPPPQGLLRIVVSAVDGTQVGVAEDSPPAALPRLRTLIPCISIRMQVGDYPLLNPSLPSLNPPSSNRRTDGSVDAGTVPAATSCGHHSPAAASARVAIPRPSDFLSLPVAHNSLVAPPSAGAKASGASGGAKKGKAEYKGVYKGGGAEAAFLRANGMADGMAEGTKAPGPSVLAMKDKFDTSRKRIDTSCQDGTIAEVKARLGMPKRAQPWRPAPT